MVKNRSGNEGSLTDPDVQNLARIAVAATEYQQQILDLFPRISDDLRNIRETQLRQHTELQSAIQRLEHHTQVQLDNAFQQLELSRKQHNEEVARLMEIIKLHVPSAGLSSAGNALNFQQSRLAQGVDPRAYLSPQVYQALQAQQLQQNLLQQGIANLGISSQPVPVSQQAPPVAQPLSSGLAPNITFPKPVTSEPPIVSAAPTTPITAAPSVFASLQKEIKKEPSVPTVTGFGEKFKLQAGEWNCAGCYAKNSGDSCLCCGTKKDGGAQVEKSIFSQPKPVSKPSGNVSFGFGSSASTATVTTTTATSVTSSAPSQTATVTTASTTTVPATTTGTPKFSFGQPLFGKSSEKTATSASTFSFKPKEGSASPQTNASPAFGAGAASGSIFGGGLSSASSLLSNAGKGGGSIFANTDKEQNPFAKLSTAKPFASLKTPSKDEGEDGDNDNVEEYEPDVHFNPVIPLPALVEVVTGEEGEKEVFKHRCKLFRFNKETKENKERGVGDIKILLDEEKNAYRVVMRREQVHKLCANFRISKGLKLSPKANMPNVYTVVCTDFSEDPVNGTHEVLTIKFKTDEIAKQFAEVFDKAAGGETTA